MRLLYAVTEKAFITYAGVACSSAWRLISILSVRQQLNKLCIYYLMKGKLAAGPGDKNDLGRGILMMFIMHFVQAHINSLLMRAHLFCTLSAPCFKVARDFNSARILSSGGCSVFTSI